MFVLYRPSLRVTERSYLMIRYLKKTRIGSLLFIKNRQINPEALPMLILSITVLNGNKAKADAKTKVLCGEVIRCSDAEKYDETHEKIISPESIVPFRV